MSRRRGRRLGWFLLAVGFLLVPVTFDTWWLLLPVAGWWVAAYLLGWAYDERVSTCSLDEACDLMDAQRRAS